jgi:hypothetical protein
MKTLGIVALIFLVGCAGRPSLEALEADATVTGDWTEVEKRERIRARSSSLFGKQCPGGLILLCEEHGSGRECECVPSIQAAGKVLGP